jgi:hypothetical protein
MAVIDKINRKGANAKRVVTGPGELVGPKANSSAVFSDVTRFRGPVDFYEITDGSGTGVGAYTVTVRPFSENGFSKSLRGIGQIALVKQTNGVTTPTATAAVLSMKEPANSTASVVLGPFTLGTNDRLFVVIERKAVSTIKYQLEVDKA